jgi:hypothetical protein
MYKCIWHTCRTFVGNKYRCTIFFRSICNIVILYFKSSYLTTLDKYISQEMKIMLDKYKHKQTKTFEHIKKLEGVFLNAQQMFTTNCTYNITYTIIPFNKIISIYKHMSTTKSFILIITTKDNTRFISNFF